MRTVRVYVILLVAAVAATALAQPASAQLFDWFGGDDHHHHDQMGHRIDDQGHHVDNHGHHTNRGVYDNGGDYYYQQPTYRYQTNYPQNNYVPSNTLPRPAGPAYSGEPIQIVCPAGLGGTVNYALNTYQFKMGAGQTHTINADRAWTISFGRGGNFGTAKYSLTPGAYAFKVTDQGWELHRQPSATLAPQLEAPAPPAPAPTASIAP